MEKTKSNNELRYFEWLIYKKGYDENLKVLVLENIDCIEKINKEKDRVYLAFENKYFGASKSSDIEFYFEIHQDRIIKLLQNLDKELLLVIENYIKSFELDIYEIELRNLLEIWKVLYGLYHNYITDFNKALINNKIDESLEVKAKFYREINIKELKLAYYKNVDITQDSLVINNLNIKLNRNDKVNYIIECSLRNNLPISESDKRNYNITNEEIEKYITFKNTFIDKPGLPSFSDKYLHLGIDDKYTVFHFVKSMFAGILPTALDRSKKLFILDSMKFLVSIIKTNEFKIENPKMIVFAFLVITDLDWRKDENIKEYFSKDLKSKQNDLIELKGLLTNNIFIEMCRTYSAIKIKAITNPILPLIIDYIDNLITSGNLVKPLKLKISVENFAAIIGRMKDLVFDEAKEDIAETIASVILTNNNLPAQFKSFNTSMGSKKFEQLQFMEEFRDNFVKNIEKYLKK